MIGSLQIETTREVLKEFRSKFNYSKMNLGLMQRIDSVINGYSYRFVKWN